jgi:hypothetical protein
VDPELEVVVTAHHLVADEAALARFAHRRFQHVGLVHVLAADEDEGPRGADRVGGDGHALDEQVRVLLHELAVLEGPRL